MLAKKNFLLIILLSLFLFSLLLMNIFKPSITGYAVASSKASIINSEPVIKSINTFSLYVSSDDNKQEDNFTICSNEDTKKVHIQVKVSDADGIGNITNVTFKILLLNGTTESDFDSFGNDSISLTFESGSGANAIYKYTFNMSINDSKRQDPLFYRIKSNVTDGISTSTTLNINYTFINETCDRFINDSFIAIANETTIINGTQDADTTIEIQTNATVNGSFSITKTTFSPVSFADFGVVALNKYIDIVVSSVINQSLTSIKLKISYTDAEVTAVDIEESSLKPYNWNGTNWIVLDNLTIDTINNFVSGTVEHFSLFALFGESISVVTVEVSVEGEVAKKGGAGFIISAEEPEKEPEEEPKEEEKAEPITEEILFDIVLDLIKTKILIGDNLNVKIGLINLGVPGRVNVSLYYTITDFNNNVILKETETTEVETQKEFIKTFKLPSDIVIGDYLISAELRYADTTATSSASFEITKRPIKIELPLIVSFIILILIILTIISLKRYRKIKWVIKINKNKLNKIISRKFFLANI